MPPPQDSDQPQTFRTIPVKKVSAPLSLFLYMNQCFYGDGDKFSEMSEALRSRIESGTGASVELSEALYDRFANCFFGEGPRRSEIPVSSIQDLPKGEPPPPEGFEALSPVLHLPPYVEPQGNLKHLELARLKEIQEEEDKKKEVGDGD